MNVAGIPLFSQAPNSKVNDLGKLSGNQSTLFGSLMLQSTSGLQAELIQGMQDVNLQNTMHPLLALLMNSMNGESVEATESSESVLGENLLEELKSLLDQLIQEGLLPQHLNEQMLETEESELPAWFSLLPDDLLTKLTALFKEHTPIEELLGTSSDLQKVESILASYILLDKGNTQHLSGDQKETLQALLKVLHQQFTQQLKSESFTSFMNQPESIQLSKELEKLFTSILAKASDGTKAQVETGVNKLDYLQALYQRASLVERKLTSTSQDSNSKVAFMGVENAGPMSRVQQFALFMEQAPTKQVNQEQFIKDFQSILAKSNFQNATGGMKLLIKLYPENLGQLRIEVIQQQGQLIARIVASNATAKEMLDSQLQGLKNAFTSQNIQVEKIEILNSQNLQQQFDRSLDKDGNNQQSSNRDKNKEQEENQNDSFESAFQEELMNLEV
ncbi:flagellar hook-length control protein FliK [Bacillus salitolerans]|uniref:Flagellar hook-length control protein FliK n=1 Tax=Bacillus salitolerans TaxID=1437434 RepID=A0ABW4LM59_9BACI